MSNEGFFFYYLDTSLVDQECPPYHKSLLASSNIICPSLSLLIILPEFYLEKLLLVPTFWNVVLPQKVLGTGPYMQVPDLFLIEFWAML